MSSQGGQHLSWEERVGLQSDWSGWNSTATSLHFSASVSLSVKGACNACYTIGED